MNWHEADTEIPPCGIFEGYEIAGAPGSHVHPSVKIGNGVKIGAGVVLDKGVDIGDGVFIGHGTVIRSGVIIRKGAVIGHLVVIEADTTIGRRTTIQSQCHITKGAKIGDDVFFGPCVAIINERRIASHGRKIAQYLEGPEIQRAARIGAGTLIMPGVTIGSNAVVGARSLVLKDVPAGECWFGNPAEKRGDVPEGELL